MIFDNRLYSRLLGDQEIAGIFSPEAEIAAMIHVERGLARAQARVGVVPQDAADAIDTALSSVSLEPDDIAAGTAVAGVPVPALVALLRKRIPSDAAHWLHWGATTQDIMDCALMLRLLSGLEILGRRLDVIVEDLAHLAEAHVDTPMAGRTRSQIATPISLGLRASNWLQGLLDQRDALSGVRSLCCKVQFGGASGANSATAPHGPAIITELARELGLEPAPPWHTNRTFTPQVTGWCAALTGSASRIASDILLMARREIAEVSLAGGGGSSTMPNKANPVSAEVVVALARYASTLSVPANLAMTHSEDRDSTAWMLEWLVLPQALTCAGATLVNLQKTLENMTPDARAMAANLALDGGAALAEAASFALASHMPRAEAQALVKKTAMQIRSMGGTLIEALEAETGVTDLGEEINHLARAGSGADIVREIVARARRQT